MRASGALYQNGLPLRDIVGEKIRSRILNGTYGPGTRLVERDLATEFQVSRSPIREAIRILNQEGFVESLATRGIVVKRLTRREVIEIFDLRESLESLASRLAAERVAQGSRNNLEEFVKQSHAAVDRGDFDSAHTANAAFHDEMINFSDNQNLQIVLAPLMGRLHWIFRQISDFEQVYREHASLAEAINSADPVRAVIESENHVKSYRTRTLEYLFG